MSAPITVAVVEDVQDTREALVALINGATSLRCVASYPTAEKALQDMPLRKPQVALVDINLPGMSGIECVPLLQERGVFRTKYTGTTLREHLGLDRAPPRAVAAA